MALLGVDLGGTKLSLAVFHPEGEIIRSSKILLGGRKGKEVGDLISGEISRYLNERTDYTIDAIGISVPGISRSKTGTVWAPNIPEWDDYPLLKEVEEVSMDIPVAIDSDRACCMLGEIWQGNARGTNDAVFLTVGTGIGAGILTNGTILRGANDIAGAIGWMALSHPFKSNYSHCGFFEYHASGEGIARMAKEFMNEATDYAGDLKHISAEQLTASEIFTAYQRNDRIAVQVIERCVAYWGMAAANLISLFNPEKILFGGGVFGPGTSLIPAIQQEACKWAQPISAAQVSFQPSALGEKAGVYGAGFLALKSIHSSFLNQNYA